MDIYLGEHSSKLLKDEVALKEKVAKFLGEVDGNKNIAIMLNLLKQGQVQEKVLSYNLSQLPFRWTSGLFTGIAFSYRRLWLAWLINLIFTLIIGALSFNFIISFLVFCVSVYVFGKLHYYFLIKKFIHKLDLNINTDNLCASNLLGALILVFVQIFISLVFRLIFFAISGVNTAFAISSFLS